MELERQRSDSPCSGSSNVESLRGPSDPVLPCSVGSGPAHLLKDSTLPITKRSTSVAESSASAGTWPFEGRGRQVSQERHGSQRFTRLMPEVPQPPPTPWQRDSKVVVGTPPDRIFSNCSSPLFSGEVTPDRYQHPLISWFEAEVREELQSINRKLDELAYPLKTKNVHGRKFDDELAYPVKMSKTESNKVKNLKSYCSMSGMKDYSGLEVVLTQRPVGLQQSTSSQPRTRESLESSIRSLGIRTGSFMNVEHDIGMVNAKLNHSSTTKELWVNAKLNQSSMWSRRRAIWSFLEIPESSCASSAFARMMHVLIICSTLFSLIQAVNAPHFHGITAAVLESLIDCVFLLEIILRFICCPSRQVFFLSIYNWIDIAAAAPFFMRLAIGWVIPEGPPHSLPQSIMLCVVPIVRLLKTLRRFEKFHLLLRAFSLSAEALPVLLFILIVIALCFAVLIYFAESRDNVTSLSHAFWLSIVTMTTVGYGDVTPKSGPGCVIVGVLVIVTTLYMAIPLGIIGNAFTDTWRDRDRILLTQRARDRLRQWGYSARDIPVLFRVTDKNLNGELDIGEFRKLLTQMQVGFGEERILKLFQSFDTDCSGTVDDQEFVKALFPEAYHEIYCQENCKSKSSTKSFGSPNSSNLATPSGAEAN